MMMNVQLWFPVLMTLLLGMMPKPGFSLSCIKCNGTGCDKPHAYKPEPCGEGEGYCFTYGPVGSIVRGCAPEGRMNCFIANIGGQGDCYSPSDRPWNPGHAAQGLEKCLKGGPGGDGALGHNDQICHCDSDNCNNYNAFTSASTGATKYESIYQGEPMPKIKCYNCTSSDSKVDQNCEVPNVEKLVDQSKITKCEGICSKQVVGGNIKRSCVPMTKVKFECWKKIMGMCNKEQDKNNGNLKDKMGKLDECLWSSSRYIVAEYPSEDGNSNCWCDSELCNSADHSSPNKKVVIVVSMMAVYFSLFKLCST